MLRLFVSGVVCLVCLPACGQSLQHRVISVVMDDQYPPFVFRGEDGELQGIIPDYWTLWEKKTGLRAEIRAMDWGQALTEMSLGKHQVIDTIFHTPERARTFNFSRPYADLPVPIFFHKNLGGIVDAASLHGFYVGVKKGDACIDYLKSYNLEFLLEFESYEQIIQAAVEGKINVFVMDAPPAHYYLNRYRIAHLFRETPPLYTGEFHRAVAKGQQDLLAVVEAGFDAMTTDEREAIYKKWMGTPSFQPLAPRVIKGIGMLLFVVLVLLAVLGAWNFTLHRGIQRRTRELDSALERLRRSEHYLSAVFNYVNDGIFVHDAEGRVVDVNQKACEMYGRTRDEVLNTPVGHEAHHDEPYAEKQALEVLRRAREEGPQIVEWHARRKNGERFWVEVNVVHARIGEDERYFVSVRDVAQRREEEARRLALERRLLQSQKLESLGLLAGGIAHDFNNMLAAIHGNLDLAALDLPPDSPSGESLAQAIRATLRASQLTTQLLAYAGRGESALAAISLTELVRENAGLLRAAISRSIVLTFELSGNIPSIEADVGQLQQLVMNLITNAVEAIGDGPGTVTLSTGIKRYGARELEKSRLAERPAPGTFAFIEVTDSGIGMNEETIERMFDPFYTTKSSGRGLGMSSILGTIRTHRGAIFVDSSPGHGTSIRAAFPLCHVPVKEAPGSAAPAAEAPRAFPTGAVLVVDDEPDLRALCVRLLDRLGLMALTAPDGRKAIELFRAQSDEILCVLLDLAMPGMDGVATYQELRKLHASVPIIMVSGCGESEVRQAFADGGQELFLRKPFHFDELRNMLEQVL